MLCVCLTSAYPLTVCKGREMSQVSASFLDEIQSALNISYVEAQ